MRIVSLLPSATEILFAVGAGNEVVAVTHECDHPAAASRLPSITASAIDVRGRSCAEIDRHIRGALHAGSSIYRLDEERLAGLHPDLIVTQELCEVCAVAYREVVTAVRRLSGDVSVLSLEPESLDGILATITAVGDTTGKPAAAASCRRDLEARIAKVESRIDAAAPRPRVVCIEWPDPLMVGGHWVPEMVRRAGGDDVLGVEGEPSRWIDWEELAAADPDVVVLMPCGFDLAQTCAEVRPLLDHPRFVSLSAALSGRVVAVNGSAYFNRPGPRIVEGLELLAGVLHSRPDDSPPSGAAWVPIAHSQRRRLG